MMHTRILIGVMPDDSMEWNSSFGGKTVGIGKISPRAAVKSENLLPTVTIVAHSNILGGLEMKEVQTHSDLLQLLIYLLLLCQRQCASSKKGRNIQA